MMFTAGYATFGHLRGLPLRWHWSLPVGLALVGELTLAPLRWGLFLMVLLVHALGHQLMIRRYGLTPIGIDLQGLGAEPRWRGQATPRQELALAWSGALAQLVLLCLAELGFALYAAGGGVLDGLDSGPLVEVRWVLRDVNALLLVINLLPLPTFDGHVAWKLFAYVRGELEPQRVMIIHLDPPGLDAQRPEARVHGEHDADVERAQADVLAALDTLTRAHNAKAGVTTRRE